MSSSSSCIATCSDTNKVPNHVSIKLPRVYVCPKCNHRYDFILRQNVFVGRVPLLLNCRHTVCEECLFINFKQNANRMVCPECSEVATIEKNDKRQLQEIFYVNFYIIGQLYYSKLNTTHVSHIKLQPAGIRNKKVKQTKLSLKDLLEGTIDNPLEACSQQKCTEMAVVHCKDCDEIYCIQCNQTIHKAARGLMLHEVNLISNENTSELISKCTKHKTNLLEFTCLTCDKPLCCYCLLIEHKGHTYKQISELDQDEIEDFRELVEEVEIILKRLIMAQKRVVETLDNTRHCLEIGGIEIEVSKYFLHLHAQIQHLEKQVAQEIGQAKNYNIITLTDINKQLKSQISSIRIVLKAAKLIKNNEDESKKFNVKLIIQQLKEALNTPCYFIGAAVKTNNIKLQNKNVLPVLDIQKIIEVCTPADGYRLVLKEDLPENFDFLLSNEIENLEMDHFDTATTRSYSMSSSTSEAGSTQQFEIKDQKGGYNIHSWLKNNPVNSTELPALEKDDRQKVIVTHIKNPESFYIQLVRDQKLLQNFSHEIGRTSNQVVNDEPQINKIYAVKCGKGKKLQWYRGRILNVKISGNKVQYNVFFIDYGNTQHVDATLLRELNDQLSKKKPFCMHCKLYNTYPVNDEWEFKAMKLMAQIITGSDIIMVVMDTSHSILEVDLLVIRNGGEIASLRDALVFIGHAVPHLNASEILDDLNMIPVAALPSRKEIIPFDKFKQENVGIVKISHIIDPFNIFVQMEQLVHHLEHLNSIMTEYYNNQPNTSTSNRNCVDNIYVPKKGSIVAVQQTNPKSQNEMVWYRGEIISVISGRGLVETFLVDYGQIVTVSYTCIRRLQDKFTKLDFQALLVKLAHVKPFEENWPAEAVVFLQKYTNTNARLAVSEVKTDCVEVVLFEMLPHVDLCINAVLVHEKIAESTGNLSKVIEWIREEKSPNKSLRTYTFDLINTIQGSKHFDELDSDEDADEEIFIPKKPVNVLLVKNPGLIYFSFDDEANKNQQLQLHLNLQKHYDFKNKPLKDTIEISDKCVIFSKDDGAYYRAVVESKIDEKYQVLLRDVAQEIIVEASDIFELEPEFKNIYEGSIRCHLTGIIPAGDSKKWSCLSIEWLQDILKREKNIYFAKAGKVDQIKKSIPVIMWYSEFKPSEALEPSKNILHNINKLLIKKGLALKDNQCKLFSTDTNVIKNKNPSGVLKEREEQKSSNYEKNQLEERIQIANSFHDNEQQACDKPTECSSEVISTAEISNKISSLTVSPSVKITSSSTCSDICSNATDNRDSDNRSITLTKPTWVELTEHENYNSAEERKLYTDDWLPSLPFESNAFNACATYVDYEANIYIHDIKYNRSINLMEEEMKRVFDNIPPEPNGSIWIPGQLCTVRYYVTEGWYRGKIIKIVDDTYHVLLIDYGNIEECQHSDLRFKIMYLNIPCFASKIHLKDVFPQNKSWLTFYLDELHKIVVEKEINVKIPGALVPNVSLPAIVTLDKQNINKFMLNFCRTLEYCEINSDSESNHSDDVIIEDCASNDVLTFTQVSLEEDIVNKIIPISIVSIFGYKNFFIEFLNDNLKDEKKLAFQNISKEISESAKNQPCLNNLEIGQACIAEFSEDKQYYRGQIIDIDTNGSAKVCFVDFGNFQIVSSDCIRKIKNEWLSLPIMLYNAEIADIELKDLSDKNVVFNFMSELCNTDQKAQIMSVNPLKIRLYNDEGILCYQNLINNGRLNINN